MILQERNDDGNMEEVVDVTMGYCMNKFPAAISVTTEESASTMSSSSGTKAPSEPSSDNLSLDLTLG